MLKQVPKELETPFHHLTEKQDENTKAIAVALESFVKASVSGSSDGQVDSWNRLIAAIDHRIEHRVTYLTNQIMTGKEINKRLREYDYIEGGVID